MTTGLDSGLFIDGTWEEGSSGQSQSVINPATETEIGTIPQGTVDDAVRAITAARKAFDDGPWGRMPAKERAAVMTRMADAMDRRWDQLIGLSVSEAGSTQMLAQFLQVGAGLEHFRDTAERVLPAFAFDAPMLPYIGAGGAMGIGQGVIQREAIGVAALITPFNFPLFLNLLKVGPALAAGCTAVLKPAPDTPLEALVLGEIAEEAGLPDGVLNIVTGDVEASAELTRNPMVDIVSFTGSDAVGRRVYTQAADTLKKVVLELGGKSANIVFSDADLDKVVPDVIANFTLHCGQGCALLTRTLVHESIHDELVQRLTAALDFVTVGDPADPATAMGPLISAAQLARVERLVSVGLEQGARLAYGGSRPEGLTRGFFFQPTVFVDVDNTMRIAREEIFGPVTVVIPFRDDDEAVAIANDSDYGLAGGVWSGDPVRAYQTARRLRTGVVTVNGGGGGGLTPHAPFGGYKQSGVGREWGFAGVEEFLQHKAIVWGAGRA